MRAIGSMPANTLALIFVFCAIAVWTVGCSSAGRHRLKTIFFTGVPSEQADEGAEADPTTERIAAASLTQERRARLRVSEFWVHGPYGSGDCGLCHALSQSKRFRSFGASNGSSSGTEIAAGARLIMSPAALCRSCHTTHDNEVAESRGLWLHAPVATGRCIACHSPHQSRRRYLLVGNDNASLCGQCHGPSAVARSHELADPSVVDCLECHNPHFGATSVMLRADYDELEHGYE